MATADISAREFWAQPFEQRERTFARMRAEPTISFHRPYESSLLPPGEDCPGFWSLTRWEDCRAVSRNAALFSSAKGVLMEDMPEVVTLASTSFLAMDGEEHRQHRGIIQQALSPRNVRKIEDWIAQHSRELVDEMIERGEGDFCELFAKQLPGRIFAHFFGVPRGSEQQHTLMDAAEKMLAWDDPECAQGRDALSTFAEEADRIQDVALSVADARRVEPRDDMVSWVVHADFEGRRLEDWEVAAFFSLLGSAANDTTRHTLGHAVRLLSEHPDQLALLREDMPGRVVGAVEEILRFASPVMHFRRTATGDTEIRGQAIAAGDKLVLWYCSGNRDEEAFADAGRFDILRSPNKHLGFGAGGPHFCIGAALARSMLSSALVELYTRMPDLRVDGEPELQVNNFIHGVHRLPVRWSSGR